MSEPPVRKAELRRVSTRSFHIQGVMTAERMQGLGFGFAMLPVLRRIYPAADACGRALRRHLSYFATHPVLSGYVLGVAARLEERRAQGETISDETIDATKRAMASPLAAMGDPLFWVTLRPLAGLLGVIAIVVLPPPLPGDPDVRVLLCPFVLLLTYNAVALPIRLRSVSRGYASAERPGALLRSLHLVEWNAFLERTGAFAFGSLLTLALIGLDVGAITRGAGARGGTPVAAPLALGAVVAAVGCRLRAGRTVETALGALLAAMLLALTI